MQTFPVANTNGYYNLIEFGWIRLGSLRDTITRRWAPRGGAVYLLGTFLKHIQLEGARKIVSRPRNALPMV